MGREASAPIAGVVATKPASTTDGRSGGQVVAATGEKKPFEVVLNLTQSAIRGEKSPNVSQRLEVPARLSACHMTLPLGSSDGLYYVRVQHTVQSTILRTAQGNAKTNHGDVQLDVELDFSNMPTGGYLLSYRHVGESWHHVPIMITNPKN